MEWVIGVITIIGLIIGILTLIKGNKKMGIIQLVLTIIFPEKDVSNGSKYSIIISSPFTGGTGRTLLKLLLISVKAPIF